MGDPYKRLTRTKCVCAMEISQILLYFLTESHYSVRVVSEGGTEDSMDVGSPLADMSSRMFYVRGISVTSSTRDPGINVVVLSRSTGEILEAAVSYQHQSGCKTRINC